MKRLFATLALMGAVAVGTLGTRPGPTRPAGDRGHGHLPRRPRFGRCRPGGGSRSGTCRSEATVVQ